MIPGKVPDKAVQEEFRDKIYGLMEKALANELELYFFDPCHMIHNNVNGYEWQEKGAAGTKAVPSNTGRKRLNIIGGLNAKTLEPCTVLTEANCDTDVITAYLDELKKANPNTERIVVILDNASYNHNKKVKQKAKELGIELEFLPAYCPNLNLIERLWKFLKKKIRTNCYYEKFCDFEEAIFNFFKDIHLYSDELSKLLTLNFEILEAV